MIRNHQIIPVLNGTNPALNGTVRKPITSTGFGDTEGFLQPAALGAAWRICTHKQGLGCVGWVRTAVLMAEGSCALQALCSSPAVLRLVVLSGFFLPADSSSFTLLLSVLALWKSSENILFLFAGHSSNTNLLNLISRCPKGTKGNEFRVLISDTPR